MRSVHDDKDYRIRATLGENLCSWAYWYEDDYMLSLQAKMCEAELFGETLTLTEKGARSALCKGWRLRKSDILYRARKIGTSASASGRK